MWNEDGTESKLNSVCGVCESGCVETIKHVLMECKAYASLRKVWWEKILQVSGQSGVAWVSEEGVGSSVG